MPRAQMTCAVDSSVKWMLPVHDVYRCRRAALSGNDWAALRQPTVVRCVVPLVFVRSVLSNRQW